MYLLRCLLGLLVAAALLTAPLACTAVHQTDAASSVLSDDAITVGSFDFTESTVLAEAYSQALEHGGYTVRRAFSLGPREFVGPALDAGLVELVPEYAGTASEFRSLGNAKSTYDVQATHAALGHWLLGHPIVALAPAPAQDGNAFVVTRATAGRYHLRRVSDLRPVAGSLVFGGPPECPTRPQCLAGLRRVYGLKFADVVALDPGGPVTHQALRSGEVDVALLFTTDSAIRSDGLVELVDDRGLQPAENVTPLVRTEVIARWGPAVVKLIDRVSSRLTTRSVRQLDTAVAAGGDHSLQQVAAAWLRSEGLAP